MPIVYPISFLGVGIVLSLIAYLLRARPIGQFGFNLTVSVLWGFVYFAIGFPSIAGPNGVRPVMPIIVLVLFALIPIGLFVIFRRRLKLDT